MSGNSKISWTDATWNCLLGCSRVSAGCDNCFAIRSAHRLQSNPNPKVSSAFEGLTTVKGRGLDWTAQVRCLPDRLEAPLHWKKPRRIFVNSLSDLFHPQVPDDFIDQVFAVMALCPQHTFQILTKRPERMRDYLSGGGTVSRVLRLKIDLIREHGSRQERFNLASSCWSPPIRWPLPNVHVGVSCENQATADERIPSLVDAPADVRFLSLEPLLGPINLDPW
ncbi:MAG TPA: DUF5131 family protein, partial [Armatimonadota bacterium]|nr:DUF5131 family protein [Armatimonadota bacterium]